ncbi:MAG: acetate--CoA ligase family protein [Synergistaceae bacterium]|jgi:acyl-CoA synthetase (NDP forming)|nr:acetate--CoA ligase family protein [Synergistaceae bacterium]
MKSGQTWKKELDGLLKPETIAVVGATEKVGPGRNTVYNLLHMDFKGTVYPVNPKRDEVFGLKCYKSLRELPAKPDLVAIALPAERVLDSLKECGDLGIRAVMAYTSGFAETGEQGAELQRGMTEICEKHEIRLCGPNCLGHLNVRLHTGAYSASIPPEMTSGGIAVISQSGSMAIAMLQYFKNLGLSHVISCGNQAVLELSDYLLYLSEDPETKVIVTFIEGVKDGRRFLDSVRECKRGGKAVVALKTGKSEVSRQAVRAHTAAIAGEDSVFDEALAEAGVIRVDDFDEMLQVTTLLLNAPKMRAKGVTMTTISGGQIGMIADLASTMGLEFMTFSDATVEGLKEIIPPFLKIVNPIDVGPVGSSNYEDYARVLKICARDPECGLILVSQDAPAGLGPSTISHYTKVVHAVCEVFREGVPVVMFSNHSGPFCPEILKELFETGVPYLQGTRETIKAVCGLIRHSFDEDAPLEEARFVPEADWNALEKKLDELSRGKNFLGEKEGKELMSLLGIPVAEQIFCADESALEPAAAKLGFPIVMKIESPDIAHKTDAGGVALGLESVPALKKAREEMLRNVAKKLPNAKLEGVTLQKMIPDGVDLIVGTHEDPQFGPVLVYGPGGIYVEVFRDSSLGLIPVDRKKVKEMIAKSKSRPLLGEMRGRAAFDTAPLEDLMLRLSEFAYRFREKISATDLNPVRIGSSGVCVLDALIILKQ